jgi:dihydrofolate reductase
VATLKRSGVADVESGPRTATYTVGAAMSVSLDGFVAGPKDGRGQPLGKGGERLFDWYFKGDTPSRHGGGRFHLSAISAQVFDQRVDRTAAVVCGRRTYDIANGWGGKGPLEGVPLVILSHRAPAEVPRADIPYTFVTEGIAGAVEQARSAAARCGKGRTVMLMGGEIIRAGLAAGLLDELELDLVPAVLGGGVPLFRGPEPVSFEVLRVIEAAGVTHLHYRVLKPGSIPQVRL